MSQINNATYPVIGKTISIKPFCLSCFRDLPDESNGTFCSAFCESTFLTDTQIPYTDDDPADGDWEEDDDDERVSVVWRPVRVHRALGWHVSTVRSAEEEESRAE